MQLHTDVKTFAAADYLKMLMDSRRANRAAPAHSLPLYPLALPTGIACTSSIKKREAVAKRDEPESFGPSATWQGIFLLKNAISFGDT